MSTPEPPSGPTTPGPALPPPPVPSVPAGWYSDGVGQRWWDGTAWGPAAPTSRRSNDDTLAAVSHLGVLAGGFVLPLALYATANETERPATRHHAREALNFQLTVILAQVGLLAVAMIVAVGGAFVGAPADPGDSTIGFSLGISVMFLLLPLLILLVLAALVMGVIAAVRASRGERYRYPLCIRFVRS